MKKIFVFLFLAILSSFSFSLAQEVIRLPENKDNDMKGYKKKEFFQLSFLGGFMNPLFILGDEFNSSPTTGIDFAYRVNKETALYLESAVYFMSKKDTLSPVSSYLQIGVGPRFYFRAKGIRSSFFFEVGSGPYVNFQNANANSSGTSESKTISKWGANGGFGGEICLTNQIFFMLKGKYHAIFSGAGTTSFVSAQGGLLIRF